MKAIVAGGRDYKWNAKDYLLLHEIVVEYSIDEIVSGMATGIDSMGIKYAHENDIKLHECPAEWGKYGRAAGPIRNGYMAYYSDMLIVWPGGRGTKNMIKQAKEAGIGIIEVINGKANKIQ